MSILERFLADHAAFRKHLAHVRAVAQNLPDRAHPPSLNENDQTFAQHLRRHARMESELLFPAMQRAGSRDIRHQTVQRFIQHGNDEHHSVAKRQAELHAFSGGVHLIEWRTTLEHFTDGLQRHMELEENEIFPLAQDLLSLEILIDLNQKADRIP